MLSDFDREWLERRRKICLRCEFGPSEKHPKGLCWRGRYCGWDKLECDMFTAPRTGLTLPDMKEAAEFEAIASMVLTVTFPFRFLQVHDPVLGAVAFCEVCKKQGLAKKDENGDCIRTEQECRRMNAELEAERHLASGTRPTKNGFLPGEPVFEGEMEI